MSVDQTNVVDAIGVDNATGEIVLTITDHLDWTESEKHLFLLQEKLNTYLRFVESGEILETYSNAKDRGILIDIVGKYQLNERAQAFYAQVGQIVEGAGIKFRYRLFSGA
ncbi:hypothetical protein NXC12_CH01948 [Rhizobium etli]|uniref:Uncharacterized protein n=1 Tax=Rhizobium etli TaxID=29449 RepID=A0AAN1BFH1_RHIET|nr:DUF6572 domain-containing protein [Rhizobium etli]ARQ09981.1 hypothetical protein NXC12_CH01948 [Rhizobium etli]